MKRLFFGVVALAIAGCGGDPEYSFEVTPTTTSSPGEVTLFMANEGAVDFRSNLCQAVLRVQNGDQWSAPEVVDEPDCVLGTESILPGGSMSWQRAIPAGLPAGVYRFHASLMASGATLEAVSSTFEIAE